MDRTQKRPLPSLRLPLSEAWLLGLALLLAGSGVLYIFADPLAAFWALASFFIYIFIYTSFLKTQTSWNTVVGGFSGAVGPLIGEAAVHGQNSLAGFWMFFLLFLWQPPHFWVLALRLRREYASVGVRMLPVLRSVRATWISILCWEAALLVAIVLAWKPLGLFSLWGFLVPSLAAGLLVLLWMLVLALRSESTQTMPVFWATIFHMLIWHISISIDLWRN